MRVAGLLPCRPQAGYPDTDVVASFVKLITLGVEEPGDLDPVESAAWDRLAEEVAEAKTPGIAPSRTWRPFGAQLPAGGCGAGRDD